MTDWQLKAGQDCFKLFIEKLVQEKVVQECDMFADEDIYKMDFQTLKYYSKILYMKYLVTLFSLSPEKSIITFAYNHLFKILNNDNTVIIKESKSGWF